MFKDNPAYKLEVETDGVRIYTPVNIADGYHTARLVEATNQQIYSGAGATRDTLAEAMDMILLRCNKEFKTDTLRTDVANIATTIKYRLQYPVDQHCSIRMGAILSFMETELSSEPTDKVMDFWIEKKVKLAFENPEMYSFFLSWGIINTPLYNNHLDTLNDLDYFNKRMGTIKSLLPTSQYSSL